jgi:hypothetical protein
MMVVQSRKGSIAQYLSVQVQHHSYGTDRRRSTTRHTSVHGRISTVPSTYITLRPLVRLRRSDSGGEQRRFVADLRELR